MQKDSLDVVKLVRDKYQGKKKIIFISGIFNIIHPGHTRLFRFAAEQDGIVIVGVLSDELSDVAIITEDERLQAIKSIGWIDHAFLLRDPVVNFLEALGPDVVVKGKEFAGKYNPELEILKKVKGKLIFSSGETLFSSIKLIEKESIGSRFSISRHSEYLKRHKISLNKLKSDLNCFKDKKIIVIGDTIIDEYVRCDPVGLSQEDPTIVVRPVAEDKFLGGAGIVAAHASSLGASVSFYTVLGDDACRKFVDARIREYGVFINCFIDETRPTTIKKRYRANNKTLLRVNRFSQQNISTELQDKIFKTIATEIQSADILIFSDFNYGILPQPLVDAIIDVSKKTGTMMVADSQSSSQVGDISRYRSVDLITPTEHEARIATRDMESGLVRLAEHLRVTSDVQHVVITLGAEGLLIQSPHQEETEWITDRIPALNTSPKDPAGAGDAFMVVASLSLATGCSIWEASYLGSIASAIQVGRVGNIPITTNEILMELS